MYSRCDGDHKMCFLSIPAASSWRRPPFSILKVEKSACGISLRFELFDKFSEMQRNGRRKRVVLVPQGSPNCGEHNVSIGARIARSATGNNAPAYPVIYSISCGAEVTHECAPLRWGHHCRCMLTNSA